jgi:hypothetical protein
MQNILQLVIQFNNQASEPLNKFKGDFAKFAEENKQELLVLS